MLRHALSGRGGAALAVLLCAMFAPADSVAASLAPDQAVALALANHSDLRAAEAVALEARGDRSASVLFLNNPQVTGWLVPDGSRSELQVLQPLSLTGEGWLARASARHAVRSADLGLARARLEVAAEARRAYIDASVARGRVAVAVEGSELAHRLSEAVRRLHEEGEASTLDLRLARLAEVQAGASLLEARRAEVEALRDLASVVGRSVSADELDGDPLAAAPQAREQAPSERADVAAAREALDAARADLGRQRAAALAPVGVGVGLVNEDGRSFIGPAVSLTVPLFDRNQAASSRARGRAQIAESELSSTVARAETERHTAQSRASEAEALGERVGDEALDEARAALASVEAGVRAGQIDLPTAVLLQTQILQGEAAVVGLRGLVAAARVDLLLAVEDDAILGGAQ